MKTISAFLFLIPFHLSVQTIVAMIDQDADILLRRSGMNKRVLLQQSKRVLEEDSALARYSEPQDNIMELEVGYEHNCASFYADDGKVKCWGSNNSGQLGLGDTLNRGDQGNEMGDKLPFVNLGKTKGIRDIVLGGFHSCVLFVDTKAKCFGDNKYGQLALGDTNNRGDQPNEMGDKLPFIDIGIEKIILNLVTGYLHTCFAVANNRVTCFGNNEHGQLGGGDTNHRGGSINHVGLNAIYADISLALPQNLYSASTANHTCVRDGYTAKCWGSNSKGQLGYGDKNNRGDELHEMCSNLPKVSFLAGRAVSYIVIGGANTCFVSNNIPYCFGDNQYGQLALGHKNNIGDDPKEMGDNLKPMETGINENLNSISVGSNHICVRYLQAGTKCFGKNASGELGQGDKTSRGGSIDTIGAKVPAIDFRSSNMTVFMILAGNSHSCVLFVNHLKFTDTVKCFGDANKGALGYEGTSNRGDEPNEMGENLPKVVLRSVPKTRSPSIAPTFKPTKQPTKRPTKSPTAYPTRKPK